MKFLNPFIIFVLIGSALWFGAGVITGMGSFEYEGHILYRDMPAEEKKNFEEYSLLAFRVGAAWALCGGVAGLIIMLWFSSRPDFEHGTLMPQMLLPPGLPGAGPQTLAELHTMPVALLVGIVGGFLLSMLYIPTVNLPDKTVLSPGMMRNVVGGISTVIATIPILPFSKSILQRIF